MEPGEWDGLVAKAQAGGDNAAIELLHSMRLHKIHQPELVVVHGGKLLNSSQRKLGTEVWSVMEQVFLAAAELGADEWRDYCLKKLTAKFPSSLRVERLRGILHESTEDWEGAKKLYNAILADKPEDVVARKRLIAMFKQRGQIQEAVEEIVKYLDTFSMDHEVWHELAELYIQSGSLTRAVFCFEELMLSNPRSMYHILTYAELLFSTQEYELSRKYFCFATYIDGNCLRALWGLVMANAALAEKDKSNEKMLQMQTFALDKLQDLYKGVGSHGRCAITLLKDGIV